MSSSLSPLRTLTIRDALANGSLALKQAGIEQYTLEARLLIQHALSVSREKLISFPDLPISREDDLVIRALVQRRAEREPMAHITGRREFWSLSFEVTAATLDPRPDSETLIETVLTLFPDHHHPLSILDMGTGSGCLLVTLLVEYPEARGLGVDLSTDALVIARRNALRILRDGRAAFKTSDWAESIAEGERFDLIISNPPYIPEAEIDRLQPEVARFEPRLALSGGMDGLDAYRALARDIPSLLNPQGYVVLEIGKGQQQDVTAIMEAAGLQAVAATKDLSGIVRCLVFSS